MRRGRFLLAFNSIWYACTSVFWFWSWLCFKWMSLLSPFTSLGLHHEVAVVTCGLDPSGWNSPKQCSPTVSHPSSSLVAGTEAELLLNVYLLVQRWLVLVYKCSCGALLYWVMWTEPQGSCCSPHAALHPEEQREGSEMISFVSRSWVTAVGVTWCHLCSSTRNEQFQTEPALEWF